MISFECDYNNGAHPKVLENLLKYNDAKPTPRGKMALLAYLYAIR